MKADNLKSLSCKRQLWRNDLAFLNSFKRKKEKSWESIEEFETARKTYLAKIRKRRKDTGEIGERKSGGLKATAAISRLMPAVYIIAALVAFFIAGKNNWFLPEHENMWQAKAKTPLAGPALPSQVAAPEQAAPVEKAPAPLYYAYMPIAAQGEHAPATSPRAQPIMVTALPAQDDKSVAPEKSPADKPQSAVFSAATTIAIGLLIFGLPLYLVRRLTRKKKRGTLAISSASAADSEGSSDDGTE